MEEVEVILGLKYQDSETGFIGTATSRVTYLHAEPLVHLENEGGARYFEEIRLKRFDTSDQLHEETAESLSLST